MPISPGVSTGALLTLDIEKPAVGGRMLARHDGQVVLVAGAIPGERVVVRVDRAARGVVYADTVDVLSPSPDRRHTAGDTRCGGNALAHVEYPRQLQLKGEIVEDALRRLGRIVLGAPPTVVGSPEQGYRLRARLHVRGSRLGFYREGTHELCDAASTGQLADATAAWIATAQVTIARERLRGLEAIEIAESVDGSMRACHLELGPGADARRLAALAVDVEGMSASAADRPDVLRIAGRPEVSDVLHARPDDPATAFRLRRDVRSFFQSNRFLLEPLARHVLSLARAGPAIDLYAGVGLFGLTLAAAGLEPVTLVEGDPVSGADLAANAEAFGARVHVERRSVESFLSREDSAPGAGVTVIVDPPRTGLSKDALAGVLRLRPARLIYVSCDPATLARDARALADAGHGLDDVTCMDLFPNTAHIETIAAFVMR